MSKLIVKDLAGPASSSNKIYIASGSELDIANSTGTINLAVDAADIASGTLSNARLAAGTIIQVKYAKKTDTFSTTSTSYVDLTDLSVSITPSSTDSKILVSWSVETGQANNASHLYLIVARDTTENIFVGDSAGSRTGASNVGNMVDAESEMQILSNNFLDSPSTTSATTYKLRIKSSNGTEVFVNRSKRDNDAAAFDGRACSSLVVMEVKA
jgi:hypothetical protein